MNFVVGLAAVVLLVGTVAACNPKSGEPLVFSEDQYREACQQMRERGKLDQKNISYLIYTPETTEQEVVFMVAVLGPLGVAQVKCGSVVMDDQGRPVIAEPPNEGELKASSDHTFQLMIVANTRRSVEGDPSDVTVYLKNDQGDRTIYPSESIHGFTPVDPECVEEGCPHVYTKFVDVKVFQADEALFTSGKRGEVTVNWGGGEQDYTFDVPTQ